MLDKGTRAGIESRGIADHDGIHSIYFRDPNGYVLELTAKTPHHDDYMNPAKNRAASTSRTAARQGQLQVVAHGHAVPSLMSNAIDAVVNVQDQSAANAIEAGSRE